MRTAYILRGLPACGKSSFAADLVKREPGRWLRVNRDDIRSMVSGPGNNPHSRDNDREDFVRRVQDDFVRQAFRDGYDVILDNTHLVPMTVKKLHTLMASVGDVKVIEKCFNTTIDECIKRDAQRSGFAQVGEDVIRRMAHSAGIDRNRKLEDREAYYPPRWLPGGAGASNPTMFDPDSSLPAAVICDLDGTLSLLNGRNPYDASTCDMDLPNLPVITCVKAMHMAGVKILFTSGREDRFRAPTERFIEQWVKFPNRESGVFVNGVQKTVWETVPYTLLMRATGDQRKDSIVKREIFDAHIAGKYNVVFALDDRDQVVDNWREMGLACFQVNPGHF